jgi:hypothetical protein
MLWPEQSSGLGNEANLQVRPSNGAVPAWFRAPGGARRNPERGAEPGSVGKRRSLARRSWALYLRIVERATSWRARRQEERNARKL